MAPSLGNKFLFHIKLNDNETYLNSVKKVSKLPISKVIYYHGDMLEGTINAGIKPLIS